ncbi:hypothetical protein ACFL5K_03855 [Gemmatimonadota bacterium]
MQVTINRWSLVLTVVMSIFLTCVFSIEAAQEGVRTKNLELYPTFECIGIRLHYEGDSDSNAVSTVRYRLKGSSLWLEAQPLARIKGNRFAGSIFFLRPGAVYEVEVNLKDPGGVSGGKKTPWSEPAPGVFLLAVEKNIMSARTVITEPGALWTSRCGQSRKRPIWRSRVI